MRALRLYQMTKPLWPFRIKILDGAVYGPTSAHFPTLSAAYDHAELQVAPPSGRYRRQDEWRGLALWAFFQALHESARAAYELGRKEIRRDEVTIAVFDEQMRVNLSADKCWIAEFLLYKAHNPSEPNSQNFPSGHADADEAGGSKLCSSGA